MPSFRHQVLAWLLPRVRKSRDLDTVERERDRTERWHARFTPGLPTALVPGFARRFTVQVDEVGGFPSYVITPRGRTPERTLYWTHGGGFVAPIDPFHVRYAVRLAAKLNARVVMPDYPLAPEHTWCDSVPALADDLARWTARGPVVLGGDSAGGGIALSLAQLNRDSAAAAPSHLLLHAPWVDLTNSAPGTEELDAYDPWLFIGKVNAYAEWWAGSTADLTRAEVSPGLHDLNGLPKALMFCGTRDLLMPGCRALADRAAASEWDLTYVERPDLLHVFPLLPGIPEARKAFAVTLRFLG